MSIDVTVIVPVFNTEKYLDECVKSIISQSIFDRMEIILVDDGSTDSSLEICDKFASEYNNIFVIHQTNAGVSAARNAGIDRASGKHIGFVDSDDYIFPDMYEHLLKSAEDINAEVSFCGFVFCYPEGETKIFYPFSENKLLGKDYIKENIYSFLLKDESFNTCCNKLFKREVVEKEKIAFKLGRKIGEDRLFTIEFLSKCSSAYYVPYAGYYYRYVPNSATLAPRKDYLSNIIDGYREDQIVFKLLGVDLETIEKNSGLKLFEQAITGLYLAEKKLRGRDRWSAMKDIVKNFEIQVCLKKRWPCLIQNKSRYETLLYYMLKKKSVLGLRLVMYAMDIKIKLIRSKVK